MQHGGRCRLEHTCDTEQNQAEIKADDKAIIAVDALHQGITDFLQCNQRIQIISRNRNICDFPRNGCAVADGNACICLG